MPDSKVCVQGDVNGLGQSLTNLKRWVFLVPMTALWSLFQTPNWSVVPTLRATWFSKGIAAPCSRCSNAIWVTINRPMYPLNGPPLNRPSAGYAGQAGLRLLRTLGVTRIRRFNSMDYVRYLKT